MNFNIIISIIIIVVRMVMMVIRIVMIVIYSVFKYCVDFNNEYNNI